MPRLEKPRDRQRRELKEKSKYHNKRQVNKRERPSLKECDSQSLGVLEVLCQSDRIQYSKGLTHEREVRFK